MKNQASFQVVAISCISINSNCSIFVTSFFGIGIIPSPTNIPAGILALSDGLGTLGKAKAGCNVEADGKLVVNVADETDRGIEGTTEAKTIGVGVVFILGSAAGGGMIPMRANKI